jgi:REP-associated tyrosine transposase
LQKEIAMPRKPRFYLPDIPVHVVQRGHSREPVFFEDCNYKAYLHWFLEAVERYNCDVHAFVLMTNHIHFLMTPKNKDSISRVMQYVGRYYVPYINSHYGTSGTIWEGRYKANLVQKEDYLLSCMRYIELNPVTASMVAHPQDYPWSSYHANAEGKNLKLVTCHPIYNDLGSTKKERLKSYRELFKAHINPDEIKIIQSALQTGTPLGNEMFKEKVERKLQCKIGQTSRGRPSKRALTP